MASAELAIIIDAQNRTSKQLSDIRKDLAGLNQSLEKTGKAFQDAGKQSQGFANMVSSSAKIAAGIITAQLLPKILSIGPALTKQASDLNEVVSKTRAVFGQSAADIEKWGARAALSLGLSKKNALEAASSFGNLFLQLGLPGKEAARLSLQLTTLAADFASFHNADITDVIQAQQAAFRGEYDSLQRFLPLINAATVETRALALTGKKSAKDLTALDKALAVQRLMIEGAGKALGDFSRTADQNANRQRQLAAATDNLKAKIGAGLLPVQLAFTNFMLTRGLPAIEKFGNYAIPRAQAALDRIKQSFGDARRALEPFIRLFQLGLNGGQIGGQFSTIQRAAFGLGQIFRNTLIPAFNDAKQAIHFFWLALQGGDAGGNLTTLQRDFLNLGKAVRQSWLTDIKPALSAFVDIIVTTVEAIKRNWGTIGPIFALVIADIKTRIGGFLTVIQGIVTVVSGVVQLVDSIIHGRWGDAWEDLGRIAEGFIRIAKGLILAQFGDLPAKLYDVGVKAGKALLQGIIDTVAKGATGGLGLNSLPTIPFVPGITPGRAAGGPVAGGKPYVVGEKGPELFVPNQSGQIIPNTTTNNNQRNVQIFGNVINNFIGGSRQSADMAFARI